MVVVILIWQWLWCGGWVTDRQAEWLWCLWLTLVASWALVITSLSALLCSLPRPTYLNQQAATHHVLCVGGHNIYILVYMCDKFPWQLSHFLSLCFHHSHWSYWCVGGWWAGTFKFKPWTRLILHGPIRLIYPFFSHSFPYLFSISHKIPSVYNLALQFHINNLVYVPLCLELGYFNLL